MIVGSEEEDDDDNMFLPGNGVANLCSTRSGMNKKYSEKNKYTRQSEQREKDKKIKSKQKQADQQNEGCDKL